MTRKLLIVAALLLSNLAGIAAAADRPEQPSKSARKIIATLNSVGINNQDVQNFVAKADARVENKSFYLTEQKFEDGRLSLRYRFGSTTASTLGANRRLELNYTPKESHFQITARNNGVMVGYHLQLQ